MVATMVASHLPSVRAAQPSVHGVVWWARKVVREAQMASERFTLSRSAAACCCAVL